MVGCKDEIGIIGRLTCVRCHLKQHAHRFIIGLIPVLVVIQPLATYLVQNTMINAALVRVEVFQELKDILICLHSVPFICFVYDLQVVLLEAVGLE